jgi:hypothetical protein
VAITGADRGPVQMLTVVTDRERRLAERAQRLGIALPEFLALPAASSS